MEAGRGGAYVPARVPCKGASIGAMTNMFWCEHASFMNGNAFFAGEDVPFADENGSFAGRDMLFADGNAAARTFGRAHRRRPYHFSYGSYHKIAGE